MLAGNIWESLSDAITQVHRLRLCRQISQHNEERQGDTLPLSPPEFLWNGDEANSTLSGLSFISEQLSD